jgi:signal transduction histidine kinase
VGLVVSAGVLLVLLWGAVLWDLRRHTDLILNENRRDHEAATEIGAQALRFSTFTIDLILLDLREHWESKREHFSSALRRLQEEAHAPNPFAVDVVARDGRLAFSSIEPSATGIDVRDSPAFATYVGANTVDNLTIIGPTKDRQGRPAIQFARPLRSQDGEFGGVITFAALPAYLLRGVRAGHFPDGTVLTVVRIDGSILARVAAGAAPAIDDAYLGEEFPVVPAGSRWPLAMLSGAPPEQSGFTRMRDPVDGRERLLSWRRLDRYPLVLIVGEPVSVIDEGISRLGRRYVVAGALGSTLLVVGLLWRSRSTHTLHLAAVRQREYLTELERREAELRDSQQRLRELAAHQMNLKEEERTRIAREIHDELGQRLTVLRMDLAMLPRAVASDPADLLPAQVAALKAGLDGIMAQVRDIAGRLRPATLDVGLGAATEGLVDEFRASLGIACELDNRLPLAIEVDERLATAAFRILQESLTNVARHANARRVRVLLENQDGCLHVQVQDDGGGIAPSASTNPSFGLSGMRERAAMLGGRVEIASHPGLGTTVDAWLPLNAAGAPGATASEPLPGNETRGR